MTCRIATGTRLWGLRGLLALACVLAWAGAGPAEDIPTIVGVEEDWELVLATPDPDSAGPQVICTISPLGNVGSIYCTLELNHRTIPTFVPGGMQFEIWNGEALIYERCAPVQTVMSQPGEVICWTHKMELSEGNLLFEIVNGNSATWGAFGGQGYLKGQVPITLASLNAYHPSVSVENSGVSYAANRVQSLVLKRVRVITSTGEILEDTTERPVYQQ